MENIWLNDNGIEFLLFSYFGITKEELKENNEATRKDIAKKCAERAYRDMCRTLTFNDSSDNERREFCEEISNEIAKRVIDKLFKCDNEEKFKEEHMSLCNDIENIAKAYCGQSKELLLKKRNEENDDAVFYYGQAQKWLNMTIKYMLMFDCFNNYREKYKSAIHVPVDNYVIKAAKELQKKSAVEIKISSNAWSKWNEGEYKEFQDSLRTALGGKSQIEWEEEKWLEIAKAERKNKK